MTDRIITADAHQVSPRNFFDALTGRTDEQRAEERRLMDERCIRAIRRGRGMLKQHFHRPMPLP